MLEGQRVLFVGGSSGIGFAAAQAAAHDGAQVLIASSNLERARAAAAQIDSAEALQMDVRSDDSVEAAMAQAESFDHLAYTAGDWGSFRRGGLADLNIGEAGRIFEVRFWGALRVVKASIGRLAEAGSITLTDGMIAHRPSRGSFLSTAMAGAIEHLVRGLAVELAPVRVNCVCPGLIRTEVWNSIPEDRRAAQLLEMTRRQPLPRAGEPGEAAQAYIFLMRAGYTTGQVVHVDGGSAVV